MNLDAKENYESFKEKYKTIFEKHGYKIDIAERHSGMNIYLNTVKSKTAELAAYTDIPTDDILNLIRCLWNYDEGLDLIRELITTLRGFRRSLVSCSDKKLRKKLREKFITRSVKLHEAISKLILTELYDMIERGKNPNITDPKKYLGLLYMCTHIIINDASQQDFILYENPEYKKKYDIFREKLYANDPK